MVWGGMSCIGSGLYASDGEERVHGDRGCEVQA